MGQIEYIGQGSTSEIGPIIGGVVGGVVILICIILFLIIIPIMCYHCSTVSKYKEELKYAQQPVYTSVHVYFTMIKHLLIPNRFIPPGQGGIEMNDNIVYQRSAGVSTAPPAGVDTKPQEADHVYEMLPGEIEEAASKNGQRKYQGYENDSFHTEGESMNNGAKDDYYVNDDLFPEKKKTEQAASGQTKKENDEYYVNDDLIPEDHQTKQVLTGEVKNDDYYVNDDLFPEKSETEQAAGGEMKENDEYVNDDLFPKQDEEEDHTSLTSVRVKDSSGDGDYYVNDDLFPNSTTVQAAHGSNHSDEEIADAVDAD